MNMGLVARFLTDRYLAPETEGIFQIAYYPAEGLALKEHLRMVEEFPLRIVDGRIHSGYLSLVPVTPRSRYGAFIQCD